MHLPNPEKRRIESDSDPNKSPAVNELIAIRQEIAGFKKDFSNFEKQLSRYIAFGVIGSLFLMWFIAGFFGLLGTLLIR